MCIRPARFGMRDGDGARCDRTRPGWWPGYRVCGAADAPRCVPTDVRRCGADWPRDCKSRGPSRVVGMRGWFFVGTFRETPQGHGRRGPSRRCAGHRGHGVHSRRGGYMAGINAEGVVNDMVRDIRPECRGCGAMDASRCVPTVTWRCGCRLSARPSRPRRAGVWRCVGNERRDIWRGVQVCGDVMNMNGGIFGAAGFM